MRALFAMSALMLASSCGDDAVSDRQETPTWSADLRGFCEARDPRWMISLVERIGAALPPAFVAGSVAFEGMHVQAPFEARGNARELQLRLTARRAGKPVALSAYGLVEPGSCAVDQLEAIEGFNRFDPPLRVTVGA